MKMCLPLLRRRMARGGGAGGMFSPRFTKKSRFGNSVRRKRPMIGRKMITPSPYLSSHCCSDVSCQSKERTSDAGFSISAHPSGIKSNHEHRLHVSPTGRG